MFEKKGDERENVGCVFFVTCVSPSKLLRDRNSGQFLAITVCVLGGGPHRRLR